MDIKLLKDKILQLAIEGKLVPQDENDEPASILLEKIKAEKEQLIKDKVIKKEKPYPEIEEDEKRFELPNRWEWIRLGEFIRFVGGNQPPKSTFKYEYQEGYIRLIQIRDYKSDSHITYIPVEKAKRFCNKDEIMIGRYGPPIFQILRGIEGAYNVALMKADPIEGIIKEYLFYLLKDPKLLKKLEHLASRTCGQDGIDMNTLKSYVVGLPPIEEQKRIVAKVDELFELIDELDNNKQELLENISNTRNKVLQLAIQGKLVEQCEDDEPASVLLERIKAEKEQLIKDKVIKKEKPLPEISEEENLFDLPNRWELSRLIDIYRFIDYRGKTPNKIEHGIPFITAKNVRKGYIDYTIEEFISEEDFEARKSRGISQKGDLLFTTEAPMGNVALADLENFSAGQRLITFQQYTTDEYLINKLFMYFIMSKYFQKQLMDNKTGTTVYGIKADKLKKLILPIPPLEEQKRIVEKINIIMNYLDTLQQEIESQEVILEDILK